MTIGSFVPYEYVLLTGAGFSYPFGGLLASEFRDGIFRSPQVQLRPNLRKLLLDEPSFELALAKVRTEPMFEREDVEALESAVFKVFAKMDRDIEQSNSWRDQPANKYDFQKFLNRFQCPEHSSPNAGFIFTLNQDLTLERHWYNQNFNAYRASLPGIPESRGMGVKGRLWFSGTVGTLDDSFEVALPNDANIELTGRTNYVKLHGSLNWRTNDGKRALVIGSGKAQQIEELPILNAYAQLFERVLLTPNRRLLVAGYSFQDDHINMALNKAAREAGLVIHIWDANAQKLMKEIESRPECADLVDRIAGTWSRRLHEVFPENGAETTEWREMRELFFQEKFPRN